MTKFGEGSARIRSRVFLLLLLLISVRGSAPAQEVPTTARVTRPSRVPLPLSVLRRMGYADGSKYRGIVPSFHPSIAMWHRDLRVLETSLWPGCVKLARETFPVIHGWARQRARRGDSLFVYAKVPSDSVSELGAIVWLAVDSVRRDEVFGRVRNAVNGLERPTIGDTARVPSSRIWGWMITEPGIRAAASCQFDPFDTVLRPG